MIAFVKSLVVDLPPKSPVLHMQPQLTFAALQHALLPPAPNHNAICTKCAEEVLCEAVQHKMLVAAGSIQCNL